MKEPKEEFQLTYTMILGWGLISIALFLFLFTTRGLMLKLPFDPTAMIPWSVWGVGFLIVGVLLIRGTRS
ncbi:MAG: hypothetical protein ACFFFG_10525 [Candidatus Thorarchaeota archaeon]